MEEKDVQRLIDMLYNMIDEAKSAAFSAEKCTINRDEALDILDEMRSKLPLELKKAKELIAARNDYVAGAKKEVENRHIGVIRKLFQPPVEEQPGDRDGNNEGYSYPAYKLFIQQ